MFYIYLIYLDLLRSYEEDLVNEEYLLSALDDTNLHLDFGKYRLKCIF